MEETGLSSAPQMEPMEPGAAERSTAKADLLLGETATGATDPEVTELRLEGFNGTMETWQRGNHDIIRVTPNDCRPDEEGEPVLPLVVVPGIHGDERIHWALMAFADEYKGPTVGIYYREHQGSHKLAEVETPMRHFRVPELELNRARELLNALDTLHIRRANVATESGGNARVEVAYAMRPDLFPNRWLDAPVGRDGRRYVGTHMSAAHIGLAAPRVRREERQNIDPLVKELASLAILPETRRPSPRAARTEQKAIAKMHHAKLNTHTAHDPAHTLVVSGDRRDPGIKVRRLRRHLPSEVNFIETDRGRHGWGQRRQPIREISQYFRKLADSHQRVYAPRHAKR